MTRKGMMMLAGFSVVVAAAASVFLATRAAKPSRQGVNGMTGKMLEVDTRAGTRFADIATARSATGLEIPQCQQVTDVTSPDLNTVYAHFADDITMLVLRPTQPSVELADLDHFTVPRQIYRIGSVSAYGYDWDKGIIETTEPDGSRTRVGAMRSFLTWPNGNAVVQLYSKTQHPITDLLSVADRCGL